MICKNGRAVKTIKEINQDNSPSFKHREIKHTLLYLSYQDMLNGDCFMSLTFVNKELLASYILKLSLDVLMQKLLYLLK